MVKPFFLNRMTSGCLFPSDTEDDLNSQNLCKSKETYLIKESVKHGKREHSLTDKKVIRKWYHGDKDELVEESRDDDSEASSSSSQPSHNLSGPTPPKIEETSSEETIKESSVDSLKDSSDGPSEESKDSWEDLSDSPAEKSEDSTGVHPTESAIVSQPRARAEGTSTSFAHDWGVRLKPVEKIKRSSLDENRFKHDWGVKLRPVEATRKGFDDDDDDKFKYDWGVKLRPAPGDTKETAGQDKDRFKHDWGVTLRALKDRGQLKSKTKRDKYRKHQKESTSESELKSEESEDETEESDKGLESQALNEASTDTHAVADAAASSKDTSSEAEPRREASSPSQDRHRHDFGVKLRHVPTRRKVTEEKPHTHDWGVKLKPVKKTAIRKKPSDGQDLSPQPSTSETSSKHSMRVPHSWADQAGKDTQLWPTPASQPVAQATPGTPTQSRPTTRWRTIARTVANILAIRPSTEERANMTQKWKTPYLAEEEKLNVPETDQAAAAETIIPGPPKSETTNTPWKRAVQLVRNLLAIGTPGDRADVTRTWQNPYLAEEEKRTVSDRMREAATKLGTSGLGAAVETARGAAKGVIHRLREDQGPQRKQTRPIKPASHFGPVQRY